MIAALSLPRDRGHVALHRPAAIIALATARRDVRQDALMTGKSKGKGDFFFFSRGQGRVTVF